MKKIDKKQEKIFNDGMATSAIEWAVANLPNIMFVVAVLLRIGIGCLLWMHTVEILNFLKHPKIAGVLAFIFVAPVEVFLTTTSFASAGLWKRAGEYKKEGKKEEAQHLNLWAFFFLGVTLLGSLVFNALMLYWTQKSGGQSSRYFNIVEGEQSKQLLALVEVMNIVAVLASEGSAFLLNSNFGKSKATPEGEQVTQKQQASYSKVTENAYNLRFDGITK